MPNLAKVLHQEIRRLTRKELQAQLTVTKRTQASLRGDITELKRKLQAQQKQLADLSSQERRKPLPDVSEQELSAARFSPRSVRSHRKRLKLSADDYARLVGVSMQTIYHWEQGKSRPRKSQLAALVAIRGIGRREALKRLRVI